MARLIFLILISSCLIASGQDTTSQLSATDTAMPELKTLSPRSSLLRSMALPGWGQITNGQAWKSPLYIGSIGFGIYSGISLSNDYNNYQDALDLRLDNDTSTIDIFDGLLSTGELLQETANRKQYKNLAWMATFLAYGINALDAYTFAHNKKKEHTPGKAVFYAALFPGLGQIYNRKFCKLPIVYAAFGTAIYFAVDNGNRYNDFRFAYITRTDEDPNSSYETEETIQYSRSQDLITLKDFYKRNMELSYLSLAGVYLLSMIDALVDGHLYNFDISDDLSFRTYPLMYGSAGSKPTYSGIKIQIDF